MQSDMKFGATLLIVVMMDYASSKRVRLQRNDRSTRSVADDFCKSPYLEQGCRRFGGGAQRGVVNDADLLSTISHIEYALRGSVQGGFEPEDITSVYISLLRLRGVRVASHYSMLWEDSAIAALAFENQSAGDNGSESSAGMHPKQSQPSLGENVSKQGEQAERRSVVPLMPLLRGAHQTSREWITVGNPAMAQKQGKFYYEFELYPGYQDVQVGFATTKFSTLREERLMGVGNDKHSWGVNGNTGLKYHVSASEWGRHWGSSVVVGCAIDLDAGLITFSRDGIWEDAPAFEKLDGKDGGIYPAASLKGRGFFRFNSFRYEPLAGFRPWSREQPSVLKTWDSHADNVAEVTTARLPVQGGNILPDHVALADSKSASLAFGVIEAVHGHHVVIRFDGPRKIQEVPLEWLVARTTPGTKVLVEKDGLHQAGVVVSSTAQGATVRLADETIIQVPAEGFVSELSSSKDDILAWQVDTPVGPREINGYKLNTNASILVEVEDVFSRERDYFSSHDIFSAGPSPNWQSCINLCKDVLGYLHEHASAVENVTMNASLPTDAIHHHRVKRVAKRKSAQRRTWRETLESNAGSETKEQNQTRVHDSCPHCEDMIWKARWVIAGYFGAVPPFAAMDMDTFPDSHHCKKTNKNLSKREIILQLQEQALNARQWILLAMGAIRDFQLGCDYPSVRKETLDVIDTMLGNHDEATLNLAFATLEASYVSMTNVVFRFEPVTSMEADWADDEVYPSKLYKGGVCTEEEYFDGDCEGCSPGDFAYVFSTGENSVDEFGRRIVNICPHFYDQTADLAGIDENPDIWQGTRVGTLIHEVSHHMFAGTDDIEHPACEGAGIEDAACYGYKRCAKLAKEDSLQALQNADNLMYLVELLTRGRARRVKLQEDIEKAMASPTWLKDLWDVLGLNDTFKL